MRLANYAIALEVPPHVEEEALDRMCQALNELDLRAKVERYVQEQLGRRPYLTTVAARVEE
jgi:hypothetical protein